MSGPVKKLAVRPRPRARVARRARPARRPVHPRPPRPAPLTPKPSRRTAFTQGEAAKKGGLLNTLLKVAPWKITGPASGPEWQEVPVGAEDYRVVAPACVNPPALSFSPSPGTPFVERESETIFAKIAQPRRKFSRLTKDDPDGLKTNIVIIRLFSLRTRKSENAGLNPPP